MKLLRRLWPAKKVTLDQHEQTKAEILEEFERLRGDVFAHHAQLVAEVRGEFPDYGQRLDTLEKVVTEVQGRFDHLTKDTLARLHALEEFKQVEEEYRRLTH